MNFFQKNTCLPSIFSQFQQPVWHGRCVSGGPSEAWDHAGEVVTAIEAVFELGKVSGHVLAADRPVGADDGGFDIAQCRVDPFERRTSSGGRPTAGTDHVMRASSIADVAEIGEAIADHGVEAEGRKIHLPSETRHYPYHPPRIGVAARLVQNCTLREKLTKSGAFKNARLCMKMPNTAKSGFFLFITLFQNRVER